MGDRPRRELSEYPRPWFYRPEIYYGFFIFPPVWSILKLRSPWHNRGQGFLNVLSGGLAWFFIVFVVVISVRGAQDPSFRIFLFYFVPGLLLTLVTQIQWAAHRAEHGPPPTEEEREQPAPAAAATAQRPPRREEPEPDEEESDADEGSRDSYAPRRRRRRRRRSISRSSDSDALC